MPQAQVLGRGSSGIATLATALGVKNAGCHPPPAVLVRGGSTISIGWEWLAVPPCARLVWSVCRSASLILTSILYHKGNDLSIVFGKYFSTDLDVIRLNSLECPKTLTTQFLVRLHSWFLFRKPYIPNQGTLFPTFSKFLLR